MAELLIEIISEEIPARMLSDAQCQVHKQVQIFLADKAIGHKDIIVMATPRRLTFCVKNIAETIAPVSSEKRGPRAGAPDKAIEGFASSVGLSPADLVLTETSKGTFYMAHCHRPAQSTKDHVADLVLYVIQNIRWPKTMRFGTHKLDRQDIIWWPRPLLHIMALWDGAGVKGSISLGGEAVYPLRDHTQGHNLLDPGALYPTDFDTYQRLLAQHNVHMCPRGRRTQLVDQGNMLASTVGGVPIWQDELLEELVYLSPLPVVGLGRIDERFMDLPRDVIITPMEAHQRYVPVQDKVSKALLPYFLVVCNVMPDVVPQVIGGYESVLTARLADAVFFWQQDQKQSLENRLPDLKKLQFHRQLGSMYEKVNRIEALATYILPAAAQAARLAKADLTTHMVYEFTELQGIMGGHYAALEGVSPDVALAIREHYQPLGPDSPCPSNPMGCAVALADKIDTIVGFFHCGDQPTGSKDPYGLRRAGLGIVRIGLENQIDVDLAGLIDQSVAIYGADEITRNNVEQFLIDRFLVLVKPTIESKYVRALYSVVGLAPRLLLEKAEALRLVLEANPELLSLYARIGNILPGDFVFTSEDWEIPPGFRLEKDLQSTIMHMRATYGESDVSSIDFSAYLSDLLALEKPVHQFFETTHIAEADHAQRRYHLLFQLKQIFELVVNLEGL
jgi:glycyl-tRNA synthetase beta chain